VARFRCSSHFGLPNRLDREVPYSDAKGHMIDLHTHSTASDGTLSPTELMQEAARAGLRAIALTDHDTVAGAQEAAAEADRHGLRFFPGVELDIGCSHGSFHLLGLNLKPESPELASALTVIRENRTSRNLQMVAAIREAGIECSYDELMQIAGGTNVGRPHFARYLVQKGVAPTEQKAFERYIGNGKRFFKRRDSIALSEALRVIHRGGGKAYIAHPLSLQMTFTKLDSKLAEWKELGLDGIEAYHSNATLEECRRLEKLAERHGLLVSAGSDFHGFHRPDRRLGRTAQNSEIEDRFIEGLLS